MMEDLKDIVIEQDYSVKEYENNINNSARHTETAVKELSAVQKESKSSNLNLFFVVLGIILVLTIIWKIIL